MYWFETLNEGKSYDLKHASLDGSSNYLLFNGVLQPLALTIDYIDNRLFWVGKDSIESIKADGSGHRLVTNVLGSPVGLTVFEDRLFYGEHDSHHSVTAAVLSVLKFNGTDKRVIRTGSEEWLSDISAYHNNFVSGKVVCFGCAFILHGSLNCTCIYIF